MCRMISLVLLLRWVFNGAGGRKAGSGEEESAGGDTSKQNDVESE